MLFNFLCLNVRAKVSPAYRLSDTLDYQPIDLALITEHKLLPRSQHFLSSIEHNFYASNTCDSSTDNSGNLRCGKAGTAIMIRKTLQKYVSHVNISNERIIGMDLRSGNQLPLYVFCVYMSSDNNVILYNETLCDIQSVFLHYCTLGTVILVGDFNAQLDTDSRRTPNQKSKLLSLFIKRNRLSPLHQIFNSNAYTHVTARSRIDHILIESSASQMYTKYSVADSHDVITCQYSLQSTTRV